MDRNYIILLRGARWFADADKQCPRHCLFSEESARAICEEMQLYPETRGAEVVRLDDDLADGLKPFILG